MAPYQANNMLTIDGKVVTYNDEPNLLEIIRGIGIDLPTFCYHSELSVYGACRLCIVEIEGRGIQTSCSTKPEPGMVVKTNTQQLRELRKISIELLLANHDNSCPTCAKNRSCQLQHLAHRLGIDKIRFKSAVKKSPLDTSTVSLVRDPNKCVLCGDCVRVCHEIQGVGAIDFANRGSNVTVQPAYGKDLEQVDCVHCGQCARVCPTGAITPRVYENDVWKSIENSKKVVVAQIAPAVRVAIGEYFGMKPGQVATGQLVAALKAIGFDRVYDTSFTADMTVVEEATEFLGRFSKGEKLPQFTSCCPAWVKFAEQYYPSLLPNLSSCKSPQQMFGSVAKEVLPSQLNVARENLMVVSIMPCTAKKYEAQRPEFIVDGQPDVDVVLTTGELAHMIETAGIDFNMLQPASLDMPLGFKTGAGVIFGTSGGVSEAVLRFAWEKITSEKLDSPDFKIIRGDDNVRQATIEINGTELKLAIVHGLAKARELAEQAAKGECPYHLIEVMSCPGGCIGGAGQPVGRNWNSIEQRAQGLYQADKTLQLHKSQENPMLQECYQNCLGEVGGTKAHQLLHTHYNSRRRIEGENIDLFSGNGSADKKILVNVCVGTSCHLRGSQDLLRALVQYIENNGMDNYVDVKATFCMEKCDRGPSVTIGQKTLERCTLKLATEELISQLNMIGVQVNS